MTTAAPLTPSTGRAVLHLFCQSGTLDATGLGEWADWAKANHIDVVTVALLGHKADLGIMALADDWWILRQLQTRLVAAGAVVASSYVSLTEISEYAAGIPDEMRQARLNPQLPPEDKPAFCFYPMSKRRDGADNWYSLDFDSRKALMMGHGAVGRTFHGRVLQVITGSTGVDDFEWGVTLFGRFPDDLKDCVYQMRFDEASARYAEFGPFYAGMVASIDQLVESLDLA